MAEPQVVGARAAHVVPRDVFIVVGNLDELGGINSWAHFTGRLLEERGHRVRIIGITGAEHPHAFHGPARTPLRLHDGAPPFTPSARRDAVRRLTGLFRAARAGGIVICTQVWAMEWIARADVTGHRVIGMTHESHDLIRRTEWYGPTLKHFADTDRVLTLTQEDADAWARDGLVGTSAMPNPLTVLPKRLCDSTAPVVVSVGRLSEEKGVDLLLEAWALVCADYPDWVLRVYGAGAAEGELRYLAGELNIAERVRFMGRTTDVPGALRAASVFALPSRAEGWGLALTEAMAHALAPVVFDCSAGVRHLVEDGVSGLHAPPGDVHAFAAALTRAMADEALRRRLGAAARASALRYEPQGVIDRWEALFDVLHRPGGRPRSA
ncbi:glycosyltransferase [Streptomyces sp. cg35]|uniref:glycosyltransferase n=1 Tax=Streptomyces sp. cg35 TaxID=3421650 RepID=UPI003D16B207